MIENPNNAGMKALTDELLKGPCPPNCNRTKDQKRKAHNEQLNKCGKTIKGCKVVKKPKKRKTRNSGFFSFLRR